MPQPDLQFGAVDYYNPEKGYGFLTPDVVPDRIFFHNSSGAMPYVDYSRLTPDLDFYNHPFGIPGKGDRLAFISFIGDQGPKASLWTFEADWLKASEEFSRLNFRVVRRREAVQGGRWASSATILFTGSLDQLEAKFPRQNGDVLANVNQPSLRGRTEFLVGIEPDWRPCADPRRVLARR